MDENTKRARIAYEAFRGGLLPIDVDVPRWEDAPNWIRDVAVVAYLQGKLDAPQHIPGVAQEAQDSPYATLPCPFCGQKPQAAVNGHGGAVYCDSPDCFGPRTTAQYLTDAAAQWNKRAVVAAQPPAAPVDLTNHHNALKCPYCNPKGLQFAEPAAPVETAQAAIRHYLALWDRCGGSTAVAASEFAEARQMMRDAVA